ncbi:uncharacterized protein LOC128882936 [Hylaeus volcanicus]|uniref:uncharacterized protein LOC128882936 n=1 Tax=Hylaeus volcanicus TaxID=313075 RepID=UPI0023B78B3D|nr:uncharacterized protein LOC128882936 [Hylaeus volcanicus]
MSCNQFLPLQMYMGHSTVTAGCPKRVRRTVKTDSNTHCLQKSMQCFYVKSPQQKIVQHCPINDSLLIGNTSSKQVEKNTSFQYNVEQDCNCYKSKKSSDNQGVCMTVNKPHFSLSCVSNSAQPTCHTLAKCFPPQKNSCRKRSFQDLRNYFRPCNPINKLSLVNASTTLQDFSSTFKECSEENFIRKNTSQVSSQENGESIPISDLDGTMEKSSKDKSFMTVDIVEPCAEDKNDYPSSMPDAPVIVSPKRSCLPVAVSKMRSENSEYLLNQMCQNDVRWKNDERYYYMNVFLCKNIQDANTMVACPNYFKNYKKCLYGKKVSAASRRLVLQCIVDLGRGIATPISDFSIHMAINLFDRYLSHLGRCKSTNIKERVAASIELVGAACLYICSKVEDSWCLSLSDICKVFDNGLERGRQDVLHWEIQISREFDFMFYSPTVLDFMYKMVELSSQPLMDYIQKQNICNVKEEKECFLKTSTLNENVHKTTEESWNSESLYYVAGNGQKGFSSPTHFQKNHSLGEWKNLTLVEFSERLAAEANSIAELSLLHHTCIGIPVHLIAAAALLVVITQRFYQQKSIENLPQPVRALLGKDRRRLTRVVAMISAVIEEGNLLTKNVM